MNVCTAQSAKKTWEKKCCTELIDSRKTKMEHGVDEKHGIEQ